MSRVGAAPVVLNAPDLIWLAGYLEGEGSFQFKKHGSVAIVVSSIDLDVLERAAMLMDSHITAHKRPAGNYRQLWTTGAYGRKGADLMMKLYPLLGKRRRQQIVSALTQYKQHREANAV